MKIRALVADDEPLARERIQELLSGEPDIDEALDTNHANARALFCHPLHDGRSAADHMFESIVGQLSG